MIIKVKINNVLQEIDAITYFENIDVSKPPELNIKVHRGTIGEDYVKDNYNVFVEQMFEFKKELIKNTSFLSDDGC